MTGSRRLPILLGILSAVLTVVAIWLFLDNPTIGNTSLGNHTCAAPYDTVLNDSDNAPGGEPSPDADEVEARCIEAGENRFMLGAAAAGAAVILAVLAAPLAVRARRAPSKQVS